MPRVHANCDYLKPLRFEDLIEMHLLVKEKREKTVTYQIRFWRIEPGPAEEVAVGHVTVVCVGRGAGGAQVAAVSGRLRCAPRGGSGLGVASGSGLSQIESIGSSWLRLWYDPGCRPKGPGGVRARLTVPKDSGMSPKEPLG